MASKRYYVFILTGILVIGFSCFLAAYLIFGLNKPFSGFVILTLVFIEITTFIGWLNQINRKIAAFFNAIHNQDTSIQMPKRPESRVMADIYLGMEKTIDVLQSVKMESQFREMLFMSMIEHSTTGFISIDEFGDFEIMNETARKLLGVEYTSNLDRMQKTTPELYETLINLEPGHSQSCRINRAGLSTIVQVSSSKLIFKDKKFTLVSLFDIQKEVDARELESWQKLIWIMNHEIMNSIAPITSASKSLMKIFNNNGLVIKKEEITDKIIHDTKNGIEVIDTMSNGLSYFVENYRKLTKIPEPIIKEIDVKKWANSLNQILKECIKDADTIMEMEIKRGIKTFNGDERLLNQVIINLVKNAEEAPKEDESKKIKVIIGPSIKGEIEIQVKNNGTAIDKENLDKIFIPFFTTKAEGAGIGLYVSKQIVNLHNGSLTVVSDSDSGTTFNILL